MRAQLSEQQKESFQQFVKFGIVGVSNTILSYVLYAGSLFFFQQLRIFPKADYLISQGIAFVLSVLWSFYWNNKKVFVLQEGQERSIWKALIKTYISYSFSGLFLSGVLLVFWVQVLHVSKLIAPIINLIFTVPINFILNKKWAFK